MPTPIIQLDDVQFRWTASSDNVLAIPQLAFYSQQHCFIKGPSGCGKSTLLSLLTGIQTPSQGQIQVLSKDLRQLSARQRDTFRADHIGYIFQQFNLLPYLSVLENIILPCQFSRRRRDKIPNDLINKAEQLLDRLHLPRDRFNVPVTELSIGQQQRVAAARAIIGEPELIIADEPTSALDHDNRSAFIELLKEEASAAGSTLIFVSHDPTLEPQFERSIYLPEINLAAASTTTLEGAIQ